MSLGRPIKRLVAPMMRWRTAKGFGVHSPFAFHFITRVLRERLPYYDFEHLTDRRARLLYRLTDYFVPATVYVEGADAEEYRRIISMAKSDVEFTDDPHEACMAVYTSATGRVIPASEVTVFSPALADSVFPTLPSATMTFANGSTVIAVTRRGLPRQDFRLRF